MCKTIKQRVKFKADPATIYDLLADSQKHTAVTGKRAVISRKIGGPFAIGESDVSERRARRPDSGVRSSSA